MSFFRRLQDSLQSRGPSTGQRGSLHWWAPCKSHQGDWCSKLPPMANKSTLELPLQADWTVFVPRPLDLFHLLTLLMLVSSDVVVFPPPGFWEMESLCPVALKMAPVLCFLTHLSPCISPCLCLNLCSCLYLFLCLCLVHFCAFVCIHACVYVWICAQMQTNGKCISTK